jgi:hypothetical protein
MDSRVAWRPPGENEEGRQAPLHLTALLRSHLLGLKGDVFALFQRVKYLDDNLAAEAVRLTPKELSEIDAVLPAGAASGERYHVQAMKAIDK